MKSRSKRARKAAEKRKRKVTAMDQPGGNSNYGRKRAFLKANGGWGWQYGNANPSKQDTSSLSAKPWRTQS